MSEPISTKDRLGCTKKLQQNRHWVELTVLKMVLALQLLFDNVEIATSQANTPKANGVINVLAFINAVL